MNDESSPPLIDYVLRLKIFKWHIQKNSFRKIPLFSEQWLTGAVKRSQSLHYESRWGLKTYSASHSEPSWWYFRSSALAAFSKIYAETNCRTDLHSAALFTPLQWFTWLKVCGIGIFPFLKGSHAKFSLCQCLFDLQSPVEQPGAAHSALCSQPQFQVPGAGTDIFFLNCVVKRTKCKKHSKRRKKWRMDFFPRFRFLPLTLLLENTFASSGTFGRLLRAALRSRIDALHNAQCNFHAFGSWKSHEPTAFAFRFTPTLCYDDSVAVNRVLRCGDGNCATACIPGHIPVLVGAAGCHTLDTHTKKSKNKKDSWMLHVRRQRLDCEMKPAQ